MSFHAAFKVLAVKVSTHIINHKVRNAGHIFHFQTTCIEKIDCLWLLHNRAQHVSQGIWVDSNLQFSHDAYLYWLIIFSKASSGCWSVAFIQASRNSQLVSAYLITDMDEQWELSNTVNLKIDWVLIWVTSIIVNHQSLVSW